MSSLSLKDQIEEHKEFKGNGSRVRGNIGKNSVVSNPTLIGLVLDVQTCDDDGGLITIEVMKKAYDNAVIKSIQ